jgi:hypothetical protein
MSLRVDTSRAPRMYRELQDLLGAVERADAEDESEWIEWKSPLDLSAKGTRATLARHIIGMANRRVAEAGRFVEGFGYVLVGIEPGNRCGVSPVDLADLGAGIEPYLGPNGPRWTASYAAEDAPPVLVISVDPPRDGDPIYTLHREYDKYRAGDIFVRKLARTVKADPADVHYLERRAASRTRFRAQGARGRQISRRAIAIAIVPVVAIVSVLIAASLASSPSYWSSPVTFSAINFDAAPPQSDPRADYTLSIGKTGTLYAPNNAREAVWPGAGDPNSRQCRELTSESPVPEIQIRPGKRICIATPGGRIAFLYVIHLIPHPGHFPQIEGNAIVWPQNA